MGRDAKPSKLKLIEGTAQPCRGFVPDLPTSVDRLPDDCPPPPDYLREPEAIKEWIRVAPDLFNGSALDRARLGVLATYCKLHAMIHSDRPVAATILTQYHVAAKACGISATSKPTFKDATEPKGKPNRWERLKAAADKRAPKTSD